MPNSITGIAHAKINLTLDILGIRDDGYHDISTIMQTLAYGDEITVTLGDEPSDEILITSDNVSLACDCTNLAWKAVEVFRKITGLPSYKVTIDIKKRIPMQAGLAGGSADAAFVLCALDHLYKAEEYLGDLAKMGEEIGSDVPFCVLEGTMLCEGKGEIMNPVGPMPYCAVAVCKPDFSISTPELYKAIDTINITERPNNDAMFDAMTIMDYDCIGSLLRNVFEQALTPDKSEIINNIKTTYLECGALGTAMSGSGPSVYALFDNQQKAENATNILKQKYASAFSTFTYDPGYFD